MKPSVRLAPPKLKFGKSGWLGRAPAEISSRLRKTPKNGDPEAKTFRRKNDSPELEIALVWEWRKKGGRISGRVNIAPRTQELRTSAASHLENCAGRSRSRSSLAGEALM